MQRDYIGKMCHGSSKLIGDDPASGYNMLHLNIKQHHIIKITVQPSEREIRGRFKFSEGKISKYGITHDNSFFDVFIKEF